MKIAQLSQLCSFNGCYIESEVVIYLFILFILNRHTQWLHTLDSGCRGKIQQYMYKIANDKV